MVTQGDIDYLNTLFVTSCELHRYSSKGRYFHLTSVENFIFYLPQFNDQGQKEFAFQSIHEYLTLINKINPAEDLDRSKSYELFKKYLDPLCDIYKASFSFTYYIRNIYFISTLLLIELVVVLLDAHLWVHVLILSLFAANFIYKMHMKRKKRIYGLYI